MLDLKHLRSMVALRERGSLVEAAQRLCMTQSALSHQIKDLEGRVGAALFVRKSKPLRFTMAGLRLLELADAVLPKIDATELELLQLVGGGAGRLHLALECHSCFNWLLPAIDHYRSLWPDVELDFSSSFSFEPLPELVSGDLDLVITSDPQAIRGLSYFPLFAYQPTLAVSPDHPLATKDTIEAEDFIHQTLVTYPVNLQRLDVFQLLLNPAGVEPQAVRQVDMTMVMIQIVASGKGVAVLPNWALVDYQAKGYVVTKALGDGHFWQNLYAGVRTADRHSPYIDAFLKLVTQSCFSRLHGIRAIANHSDWVEAE